MKRIFIKGVYNVGLIIRIGCLRFYPPLPNVAKIAIKDYNVAKFNYKWVPCNGMFDPSTAEMHHV
jgi:hypothetical protein